MCGGTHHARKTSGELVRLIIIVSSAPSTPRSNENTVAVVRSPDHKPQLDVDQMWLAWDHASQAHLERGSHDRPGYQLIWTWGRASKTRDLPAEGQEYMVIGRHSECDVVLDADPQLSLRHLLARTLVLDDGAVALRLMSLGAGQPFFLEDGIPRWSIVAVGPLMLRLGRYVIGAFPHAPHRPQGGPYRAPTLLHVEASSVVPRIVKRSHQTTHVSVMAPPPSLSEMAPKALPGSVGRLTLRRGRRVASVDLQHEALERGVLIGRAKRCLDEGLGEVLHGGISRTHLLLLREKGGVYTYDLCSLQGSYNDGQSVRRCRLSDQGAILQLARRPPVCLTWHPTRTRDNRLH